MTMRKVFFFILAFLTLMLGGHPAHAETPGVTDTEVKLGQSASFKGTSSALGTELWRSAETYFKYINGQDTIPGDQYITLKQWPKSQ